MRRELTLVPADDWPEGLETITGECDRCGKVAPCMEVVDPFVAEGIYDQEDCPGGWWCRPCFIQRLEDV